jgi:hypothetical protein
MKAIIKVKEIGAHGEIHAEDGSEFICNYDVNGDIGLGVLESVTSEEKATIVDITYDIFGNGEVTEFEVREI